MERGAAEEAYDEGVRERVGVLDVGWEAGFLGAEEGEGAEAEAIGGRGREGGLEVEDVEGGVDEGNGEVREVGVDVDGEGEEWVDVALRHEGEQYDVASLLFRHCKKFVSVFC